MNTSQNSSYLYEETVYENVPTLTKADVKYKFSTESSQAKNLCLGNPKDETRSSLALHGANAFPPPLSPTRVDSASHNSPPGTFEHTRDSDSKSCSDHSVTSPLLKNQDEIESNERGEAINSEGETWYMSWIPQCCSRRMAEEDYE